jgi:hypothetical protein
VFRNNWVSFHAMAHVLCQMAVNRRLERRLELLPKGGCHRAGRTTHRSTHENQAGFEGTGSLVLDHVHRVAYACRSSRTDDKLVHEWAQALQYHPVVFDATSIKSYHTQCHDVDRPRAPPLPLPPHRRAKWSIDSWNSPAGTDRALDVGRWRNLPAYARAGELGRSTGRLFGAGDVGARARCRQWRHAAPVRLRRPLLVVPVPSSNGWAAAVCDVCWRKCRRDVGPW